MKGILFLSPLRDKNQFNKALSTRKSEIQQVLVVAHSCTHTLAQRRVAMSSDPSPEKDKEARRAKRASSNKAAAMMGSPAKSESDPEARRAKRASSNKAAAMMGSPAMSKSTSGMGEFSDDMSDESSDAEEEETLKHGWMMKKSRFTTKKRFLTLTRTGGGEDGHAPTAKATLRYFKEWPSTDAQGTVQLGELTEIALHGDRNLLVLTSAKVRAAGGRGCAGGRGEL